MTYGETARELRESMTWLLGRHRILHLLGDPEEQARLGEVIQRYRDVTTAWCLQAVTAATLNSDLADTTSTTRDPVEELRYRLGAAVPVASAPPDARLVDLLATRHGNDLVDGWQRAAHAAALGEREVAAGVNWARMPAEQSYAVLKDASDITRALVLLDARYSNIPDWWHLTEPRRLGHAAEACSLMVAEKDRDYGVDERGWSPAAGIIEGAALPGVAGAVQAEHNMVVDLARFPNALNLRRVLLSQAKLSHEAVRHAEHSEPALAETFRDRAALYGELVRSSRDIGGLAGSGGYAAVESHNAETRLQRTPAAGEEAAESMRELARICTRADSRIAATIEHGFQEKLYFVAVNVPRFDHQSQGIHQVRQRWVPVTSQVQTPLLGLARDQLRPPPVPPQPSPESRESRAAYEAVIAQELARVGYSRQPR